MRPKQRRYATLMVFIGRLAGSAQPICQRRVLYVPYCRAWSHHGSPSRLPVARGRLIGQHDIRLECHDTRAEGVAARRSWATLSPAGPRRIRRLQLCTPPRRRTAVSRSSRTWGRSTRTSRSCRPRGVRPRTDNVASPSGRVHEMSVPSPVNENLLSQRLGALGSARSWDRCSRNSNASSVPPTTMISFGQPDRIRRPGRTVRGGRDRAVRPRRQGGPVRDGLVARLRWSPAVFASPTSSIHAFSARSATRLLC